MIDRKLKIFRQTFLDLIIFVLITSSFACQTKVITEDRLIATWVLVDDQIDYPVLDFNKSGAAKFWSRSDTIYYFSYQVDDNCLILNDGVNPISDCNKIIKLTKNTLVFENLLEHDKKQHYRRYQDKKK
jgi:hypothetical protein